MRSRTLEEIEIEFLDFLTSSPRRFMMWSSGITAREAYDKICEEEEISNPFVTRPMLTNMRKKKKIRRPSKFTRGVCTVFNP
jgi:hypothetical protein